jgi:hypothetical protein
MAFVQNMVTRFRVGPGAHDGQIGVVTFATLSVKAFDLNDHQTNGDVISALGQMQQACASSMCGRCPGYAMKLASDQVLCSNCPGRPPRLAPITAIFLTASDPGLIAPCDSANGNQGMDRIAEIIRFKGLVERVIPVGIGSAVSGAYLQGLAKNMPIQSSGANYLTAEYANLASITGVITDAACPLSPPTMMPTAYPTAFPTAAPSDAPTTEPSYAPSPQPTKQPTFNCQECRGISRPALAAVRVKNARVQHECVGFGIFCGVKKRSQHCTFVCKRCVCTVVVEAEHKPARAAKRVRA